MNYTLAKGMDLGFYGAYAFLSDWETYNSAGVTTVGAADADDIYKMYVRMNYAF